MNRSDFYFKQNVTQAEVDQAFDDCENADRNLIVDQIDVATTPDTRSWGVVTGLNVSQNSGGADLNVEISNGVAYDEQGRRIPHTAGPTLLDLATAVPGSDSRYVRVYAEFTRVLSDPRVDGLAASIDYRQTEGVLFSFDLGTPAASPTKPALLSDKVCLATIIIATGATQILDADISEELPSVGGLSVPDRHEGGALYHGGILPTRRKLHYGVHPVAGGEEVVNLGTGNHLQVQGGTIRMAPIGTDGGAALFGEYASIYKAGEVRVAGLIQDGGGYWYSNPTSDEFGEPLQALNKYLQFDPANFTPAAQNTTPQTTAIGNYWRITNNGGLPLTGAAWEGRATITAGNFWQTPLFCPLSPIQFRSQLVGFEWEVEVTANKVDLEFGIAIYRRGIAASDITMLNNGGTVPTTALTVGNRTLDAGTIDHLARPDLYVYFAAFWVYAVNSVTDETLGIRVTGCRLNYQIREASHEYYHPTL